MAVKVLRALAAPGGSARWWQLQKLSEGRHGSRATEMSSHDAKYIVERAVSSHALQ